MFKTIDSSAVNLSERIGILHRSYKDIITDFSTLGKAGGIKNFKNIFNIATDKDINNLNAFQEAIKKGYNETQMFNKYLSNSPTSIRKTATAFAQLNQQQIALKTSYDQNRITLQEYNSQNAVLQAQLDSTTAKVATLTIKQKALNAVMKIGSTVANMALNVGISIAISAIVSAIYKVINANQELIEKNKELANSYSDNIKSLQDFKEQYLEIVDSTESETEKTKKLIDWKKQLVEQYGLEEDALKKVNIERQTGISLIDKEIYDQANSTIATLQDYDKALQKIYSASTIGHKADLYSKRWGDDYHKSVDLSDVSQFGLSSKITEGQQRTSTGVVPYVIQIEYDTQNIYEQADALEKALAYYKNIRDKGLDPEGKNSATITYLEDEYSRIQKIIDDYGETVTTGVSAYAQKYLYEFTQQTDGALANVIDQASFNAWKDKLLKMAGDSDPVKKALEKLANEMFPNYSSSVDNSTATTNNATTAVTSLADAFKALKEALEDIINDADAYQSAMQKISAGIGLTTDEVLKILEIDPSLFDKFIKQKDGTWTIPIKFLTDSYDSVVVNDNKDAIADQVAEYQSELDIQNARLQELTKEYDELVSYVPNGAESPSAASERNYRIKQLQTEIDETEKHISDIQKNINLASFYEKVLDYSDADRIRDSYDEVVKKIDEYNDGISSLNKAIDTINEGNSLSYDEMTQLIELYPELEGKVIETANGYTIEVNALEDVRTQSYKTRNDYIDDRTAEVAALREDVKQQIEEYKRLAIARIVSENSHGNYIATTDELLENDPEYQALLLKLELYDEYFNKVVGYKRTVTGNDNSGSSDKSVSNSLQNQIDYYEMLLEAIEIVTDKVIDGLEKEKDAIDQKIDALNDEKDALQEKNDEQQRELDLIEAKNNLDKAKKQKVFVYKEGQGLVQVQDEKAVSDAQKEYDDIQNEIKEAEIDKKIKVLEKQDEEIDKQIDGWTEYKDQFSNMGNDIKDTLTVEQAKKALGTDEQGLLSLDDKTFNVIRDGLATATYNKDVNDNKENSKYVTVKLEDYLKSVGATVTPTEFKAMASTITNNPANIVPATNANSTINNAQTINNKTANFNATFNIYDALDPHKIIDTVKEYFNGVLKQTINSVK